VGVVRNVHRVGNHVVADLLVTRSDAIHAVRDLNWRSVSAGYDAGYLRVGIARARQVDIRGNHLAILDPSEEARCGEACRIQDSKRGNCSTWGDHGLSA
jgi:hypothetical protein